MNKADGTLTSTFGNAYYGLHNNEELTSPYFGVSDGGGTYFYDNNLKCTWILNADKGFYITLKLKHSGVKNDDTYKY